MDKVYLSSPTMHGDELKYMQLAYDTNWMSTVGENINEVERLIAQKLGCKYTVALSCGTAALHLCMKLANIKPGDYVFATDMTFGATVNPIVYEGGIPIFIDAEYDTWNMDPVALEKAFELYPNTKVVVCANLYGTPAKLDQIVDVCNKHNAILIEDAAESLGASLNSLQTGTFGKYNAISFNGNKIITGTSGGMLLTDDLEAANKARKWSTQSREAADWYQHEEIGYNYRMSNVIAGVVRGQIPYLEEHIAQKKAIYERYKQAFKDLPITMNPIIDNSDTFSGSLPLEGREVVNDSPVVCQSRTMTDPRETGDAPLAVDEVSNNTVTQPNYWLSCLLINKEAMSHQVRSDNDYCYTSESGKTCPQEILDAIKSINAEGRPIWKPMHMQPIFMNNPFVTINGNGRAQSNAYISGTSIDVGKDIFHRGLCLPSDNKMTVEQQDRIINTVRKCFD